MRWVFFIFLSFHGWLFAVTTDFDVAVVGTSPISMLEAIYHLKCNQRVLIIEEESRLGGAWKSVDICGIANADLGCHLIGSDIRVKEFLDKYFDCRFVCLEHPTQEATLKHQGCSNGFYFSGGCHELVSRLEKIIESSPNAMLLHQPLKSIFIDTERNCVELNCDAMHFSVGRLIMTPASAFHIENPTFVNNERPKHHYYHLYMLVEDLKPVSFTYLNGIITGMSRAMNLTPFLHMPDPNLQLIVVQTYRDTHFNEGPKFLEAFKNKQLLSENARILMTEHYVYDQSLMNVSQVKKIGGPLIEILDSSSFMSMAKYFDKWKSVMTPVH